MSKICKVRIAWRRLCEPQDCFGYVEFVIRRGHLLGMIDTKSFWVVPIYYRSSTYQCRFFLSQTQVEKKNMVCAYINI